MTFFFSWYPFLFQRYSSSPIMQIWSLMTSSVVHVQWCDTKLRISPPILKRCYWNLAGMVHILMLLWQHAGFQSPASSKVNTCITICDSTRQNTWSYLRRMAVPPSLSSLFNIFSCIWCPVQLLIIIFDFEEAGDWNQACCHSNIKMCTIWYIL